jgi:hypothetical protein
LISRERKGDSSKYPGPGEFRPVPEDLFGLVLFFGAWYEHTQAVKREESLETHLLQEKGFLEEGQLTLATYMDGLQAEGVRRLQLTIRSGSIAATDLTKTPVSEQRVKLPSGYTLPLSRYENRQVYSRHDVPQPRHYYGLTQLYIGDGPVLLSALKFSQALYQDSELSLVNIRSGEEEERAVFTQLLDDLGVR